MMKRLLLAAFSTVFVANLFAQTVEDGKKFLYYEQFRKAKETLNQVLAAKPNDPEALYWMGQAYIYDDSVQAARDLYARAMTSTNQNPLIMVGMGHVEVLEKKKAEARAHFDAAIAATASKKNKKYGDPTVLAAIGRANADGASDVGDPDYGIEKLTQAAELDTKNPEIMGNMGVTYLKKGGEYGGQAKRAFENALERDPTYARSNMRIGRIFESQRNTAQFLDYYTKAIETDPKYAPAYLALYNYYQNRDVNKAGELLAKYVAIAEPSPELKFFEADYKFRSGKYQESLDLAKALEASLKGEKFAKLHKLYSLNYDRLGDSVKAVQEMETYITEENPAKLAGDDYSAMASLYTKFPESLPKADEFYEKAINADTVVATRMTLARDASDVFGKAKDYERQYKWMSRSIAMKPELVATDYYYWELAAENAAKYDSAIAISKTYITKYPDQPQGYAAQMRAAIKADPDTSKGLAISAVDQYNEFLRKDTAKNKNRIIANIGYKVYYYVNKAKDYEKAIAALDEILALDPENSYAKSGKEQLLKIINQRNKSGGATKPSPAAASGNKNGK